jgi:hypothetical protein
MQSKTRKAAPRAETAAPSRALTTRADGNVKGDPSTWPEWTDAFRWELGAGTTPVAPAQGRRSRPAPAPGVVIHQCR